MKLLRIQLACELRVLARNGEQLLLILGIPMLLLSFFSNVDILPTSGQSSVNFLLPGIVALAIMSTAMVSLGIATGFERAWGTILDSNITTLIAGIALLAFGSGPVRGFAVVHSLGILTSMFSAVFFSRGIANLWYGRQKKLQKISIGQVWRPTE